MTRTCPICHTEVEQDATACPNCHEFLLSETPTTNFDLSGAGVKFQLPSTSEQELRPMSTSDLGHLPSEAVIRPITVGELPTRPRPTESIPEIHLLTADEATDLAEYVTLAVFRLPEDELPLSPIAVQVGPDETLDVVDAGHPDVFRWIRFSQDGGVIQSVSIPRGPTGLEAPAGIALDTDGRLYVVDLGMGCVWRYEASGTASTIGQRESLDGPLDVALDQSGNLLIAESSACRILKLDPTGGHILSFGAPGPSIDYEEEDEEEEEEDEMEEGTGALSPNYLSDPGAVAVDAQGNIYIADTNHHRILKLDADGTFVDFVAQGVELLFPSALQVSTSGELFVADLDGSRIHKFDSNDQHLFTLTFESGTIGGEFDIDNAGDMYLPDKSNHAVLKVRYVG